MTAEHTDAQLTGLLVKHFKKTSFKNWQLTVIKATVDGKNSLIVQPTGSEKSLCFQFPGVVTEKITVILMPTVSLIMNQFEAAGVKVNYLGSMQKTLEFWGRCHKASMILLCAHPSPYSTILGSQRQSSRAWWFRKRLVCWQSMKPI